MLKSTRFQIAHRLKPTLLKNTKCIKAIHVEIYVSCVIYKLEHGYNFLICSKLFAIVKSIISLVLHEFVVLVNMFLGS